MSDWSDIETAPRDGSTIWVRRIYNGMLIYEGPACWREISFASIDPHPLTGDNTYGASFVSAGWAYPHKDKLVPTPTHWRG